MFIRSSLLADMVVFSTAALSDIVLADTAYVARSDNLRSGPDYDFSSIRHVSRNRVINVFGCTNGYEWCDIEYRGDRGWFPGDNIVFEYEGRRTPLRWVAPLMGLVILDFTVNDYWDRNYSDRSWYDQRQRYSSWQMRDPRIFDAPPLQETWPNSNYLPPAPPQHGVQRQSGTYYNQITPNGNKHQKNINVPFLNPNIEQNIAPRSHKSGNKYKTICPEGQVCY